MRTFLDSTGLEWTVYEVKNRDGAAERWSYLPGEFGDGWLCFESDVSKRRLTPIPPEWRTLSDTELVRKLGEAQTVVRPTRTTVEDRAAAD